MRTSCGQNDDAKQEIIELCMMSQAFDITSSGDNTGHLLWSMALEKHTHVSKATTESVRNNVYVDDIPKSHGSISESIICISELVSLCMSGGFPLSKFISNERVN